MWGGALSDRQGRATHFTTLWLRVGEGSEKGRCHCLASGGLTGRKLSPGTHPDSSHFTFSLCTTCGLPAVALGLNPRAGGSVWVQSPCGCFKRSLLKIWCFFFLSPRPPLVFTVRSYRDLSSWRWTTGVLGGLVWGWDHSLPRYPSRFLSTTHECGTTHSSTSLSHSMTLPLLPIWMNVASLNPWLSDFYTAGFSDNSGCYLFCSPVVIFSVVVWGGEAGFPMPPSWPEATVLLSSGLTQASWKQWHWHYMYFWSIFLPVWTTH